MRHVCARLTARRYAGCGCTAGAAGVASVPATWPAHATPRAVAHRRAAVTQHPRRSRGPDDQQPHWLLPPPCFVLSTGSEGRWALAPVSSCEYLTGIAEMGARVTRRRVYRLPGNSPHFRKTWGARKLRFHPLALGLLQYPGQVFFN